MRFVTACLRKQQSRLIASDLAVVALRSRNALPAALVTCCLDTVAVTLGKEKGSIVESASHQRWLSDAA